jgi:hypothetical protein
VAGTDNVGNKQGDSNYGSWVALAAPESNMTAWPSVWELPLFQLPGPSGYALSS